jgi:hypothetical protein
MLSGPVHIGAAAPPQLIRVLLDHPDRVFPVKIAGIESAGELKKAIKEEKKQRLRGIDADCLDLRKVRASVA